MKFSMRKAPVFCFACIFSAGATLLSGCSEPSILTEVSSITAGLTNFSSSLSSKLKALNTDIQAGVAASAPQLCADATLLDTDFQTVSKTLALGASVITDEATAIQAVRALCANTSGVSVASLVADAAALHAIISSAEAAK